MNKVKINKNNKGILPNAAAVLLTTLKQRFEKNSRRHKSINWQDVEHKLFVNFDAVQTLHKMEATGGEPDVIGYDKKADEYIFCDCSPESPAGRRSICYDHEALLKRKENKPANSAVNMAEEIGIEILDETQYRHLQTLDNFDLKTSSWILTPPAIRKLGGAIFCDKRYGTIFTYHNGAESYYAGRGFRGILRV
jgi:hypothetical protein